ncbi:MAG TPA: hypothetical protein VF483_12830 [Gemmatimonadaceae bacterium]
MRLLMVAMLVAASGAHAQLAPEVRVDFSATGAQRRAEAGAGLGAAMGPYLRAGLSVSYDLTASAGQPRRLRVENLIRFLFDPIAQDRWALSVGGGLGVRQRAYMMVAAELEGPRIKGARPALQYALGAGQRLALVIRRARNGRR